MGEQESKTDSLVEELLAVYEELNLFYDISASLSYFPDIEKTIDLILNKAMEIVGADKASLLVLDDSGNTLRFLRRWAKGSPVHPDHPDPIIGKGTILDKALQAKKGLIMNDLAGSVDHLSPLIAVKSLLCIPLHGREGMIGALTLGDRNGKDFTSNDLKLSTVLASQAALVIENSRLVQAYLEKQNLERELQIAREIQERMQPVQPSAFPGVELAALSVPCLQVGGDFYDFIPLPEERLVILIGDVMGHGVGAALLMATVKSALRVLSEGNTPIPEILSRVNKMLLRDLGGKKYLLTLFYGILNGRTRSLTFSNAGHEYPIILRSFPAQFEFLKTTGTVMGAFENTIYDQSEIQLNPGDRVLFYTDGVVEARGGSGEQFGKERLYRLLEEKQFLPAQDLLNTIYREVTGFSGSKSLDDDLLLLTMRLENPVALGNERGLNP